MEQTANNTTKDLGSVLSHIENLQKQLAAKDAELKETKHKEEEARMQAEKLSNINTKLTEAKREAMKEDFNNNVRRWVGSLDPKQVPDALKEEFLNSCEKFTDKGDDTTGVWKVSPANNNKRQNIQALTHTHTGHLLCLSSPPESGQHHPKAD